MSKHKLGPALSSLVGIGLLFALPVGWLVYEQHSEHAFDHTQRLASIESQVHTRYPVNLDQLRNQGSLRVGTLIAPGFYIPDDLKTQGIDYDLAQRFAQQLDLDARFTVYPSKAALYTALQDGEIDLAAAALIADPNRAKNVYYAPPYLSIHPQWFVHRDTNLDSIKGLHDFSTLAVTQGSYFDQWLISQPLPKPRAQRFESSLQAVKAVDAGLTEASLLPSTTVLLAKKIAPDTRAGPQLPKPRPVSWALAEPVDPRIIEQLEDFFIELRQQQVLDQLLDRYFLQFERLDISLTHQFLRDLESRLPRYEPIFMDAAAQYNLDWRLLAAMGYQESKWRADAVSGQQAQGIMQIVPRTARSLDLQNPFDAVANIHAGARYIAQLRDQMDDQTPEPDRTYLALAAYNIGIGHLGDALMLTEQQGGNRHQWPDVRQRLPMMMNPEIYQELTYGYARGTETFNYVENIRAFHDLMVWQETLNSL